eukprot:CAMPEP_0202391792 /NCGR_PEP_ID=MMETSP1127-20130417/92026_1 /ASSEMBLY_ACC=CAM_ASM_000462 /TAXON_ID=3047 /ORGANISM="Dunaliella tertiolecta, Strain CCMP1320" /LENGTH=1603 /DNA_ID=CAMNT_0048994249 /DNA_START=136 /DNA_END=4947 /DNA_ORIENTATION=+
MYAFAGPVERMAKAVREHRTTGSSRNGSRNKSSASTSTNCSSTSSCSPLSRVCTSALRVNSSPLQQQQHPPQNQSLFHRLRSATTSTTLNWWSTLASVVQVPSTSLLPFSWPLRLNSTLSASSTTSTAPTALPDTSPPPSPLPAPRNQAVSNSYGSGSGVGDSGNGGSNGSEPQPSSDQRQLLSSFLAPADENEIRYACLLSDLSNAAYDISSDALSSVLEKYQLSLATTSASCSFGPVCLADWEAEVDHGMAWTGNHAQGEPGSPPKRPTNPPATNVDTVPATTNVGRNLNLPATNMDNLGPTARSTQQPVSEQGQPVGHTSKATARVLPVLDASKDDEDVLQAPTLNSSSRSSNANATTQNACPANSRRPTSPASFPPTPEVSHTPHPRPSPSNSPSLSRSHSSSNLVADAPPLATQSPSVTLVSLSNVEETVGMAMAWPEAFHYPLLTQVPRALAPTPTRRSSADGIAASFADPAAGRSRLEGGKEELTQEPHALAPTPAQRSSADGTAASFVDPAAGDLCRLLDADGSGAQTEPHSATPAHYTSSKGTPATLGDAHHTSSEGSHAISKGAYHASSEGTPATLGDAHHTSSEGSHAISKGAYHASSEGSPATLGDAHTRHEGREEMPSVFGQAPLDGGACCESAGAEEDEDDLQLRLWARKQQAMGVAMGGSASASACSRDEPEAPGTPPQQVEHTFRQRYSPPNVHLPHPPLSAPALVDSIEVTELALSCGPEAEPAQCSSKPPCDWFVCDDKATNIRYFAIQGSITLQHWQINLQFDPVIFEDPAYGVRVHRGVYEAALKLYDDLVPLVRQHLASAQSPSQPPPRIAFTGHSLGGSLSTLLTLLLLHRGAAHPQQVAPAYTFGAPAVFCGGEDGAAVLQEPQQQRNMQQTTQQQQQQQQQQQHDTQQQCCEEGNAEAVGVQQKAPTLAGPAVSASAPAADACAPAVDASMPAQDVDAEAMRSARCSLGILQRLGLTDRHFVNIIMHRDIVPRAFGCDYALVADLLKQWLPSFKTHPPLQGAYKSLYNFLGSVAVLKPHASSPFVQPADAGHPLLPELPGLFHLRAPSATDASKQRREEHRPQATPAAQASSMQAAVLSTTPTPRNPHAVPAATATHSAVPHSHAIAASAVPPQTLPPSVSPSSASTATATARGEGGTLCASTVHGPPACKGAAQTGSSAADEQLDHTRTHHAVISTPQRQQAASDALVERLARARFLGEVDTSNFFDSDLPPSMSHPSLPSTPHPTPLPCHAYSPQSTATTAAHHTPALTFPPTSASTVHAAAAAVAAAVHAHPAEADMGPGSLQDQAAVAAAAVAAAAAATAFSGDNLAPRHPRRYRPATGASSPSPAHASESRRPAHRASGSEPKEVVPPQPATQQQQQQHSNNILAAGGVRQLWVSREHQALRGTVVLGVGAHGVQSKDNGEGNLGSTAAAQIPAASAAAVSGSSGDGGAHSSNLSINNSSNSSSRGSLGDSSETAAHGMSSSYGPVGPEHGGGLLGGWGKQQQWKSTNDERERPQSTHQQLSPALTLQEQSPAMTLQEATQLFLNTPHPLTTLSEYTSYGSDGAISRYHNPDNYTKGLTILADLACLPSQHVAS